MGAEAKKSYHQESCPFCGQATWFAEDGSFTCEKCGKAQADLAYTPTEQELAWWSFLRFEYAHGRVEGPLVAGGVDPGAPEPRTAVSEYPTDRIPPPLR